MKKKADVIETETLVYTKKTGKIWELKAEEKAVQLRALVPLPENPGWVHSMHTVACNHP
jgi:hypothetical protein